MGTWNMLPLAGRGYDKQEGYIKPHKDGTVTRPSSMRYLDTCVVCVPALASAGTVLVHIIL